VQSINYLIIALGELKQNGKIEVSSGEHYFILTYVDVLLALLQNGSLFNEDSDTTRIIEERRIAQISDFCKSKVQRELNESIASMDIDEIMDSCQATPPKRTEHSGNFQTH